MSSKKVVHNTKMKNITRYEKFSEVPKIYFDLIDEIIKVLNKNINLHEGFLYLQEELRNDGEFCEIVDSTSLYNYGEYHVITLCCRDCKPTYTKHKKYSIKDIDIVSHDIIFCFECNKVLDVNLSLYCVENIKPQIYKDYNILYLLTKTLYKTMNLYRKNLVNWHHLTGGRILNQILDIAKILLPNFPFSLVF